MVTERMDKIEEVVRFGGDAGRVSVLNPGVTTAATIATTAMNAPICASKASAVKQDTKANKKVSRANLNDTQEVLRSACTAEKTMEAKKVNKIEELRCGGDAGGVSALKPEVTAAATIATTAVHLPIFASKASAAKQDTKSNEDVGRAKEPQEVMRSACAAEKTMVTERMDKIEEVVRFGG